MPSLLFNASGAPRICRNTRKSSCWNSVVGEDAHGRSECVQVEAWAISTASAHCDLASSSQSFRSVAFMGGFFRKKNILREVLRYGYSGKEWRSWVGWTTPRLRPRFDTDSRACKWGQRGKALSNELTQGPVSFGIDRGRREWGERRFQKRKNSDCSLPLGFRLLALSLLYSLHHSRLLLTTEEFSQTETDRKSVV